VRRLPLWLALSVALVAAGPAAAAPSAGETIVSALAGPPKSSFLARIRAGEMGGVILVGRWKPAELLATTQQLHSAGCAAGRVLALQRGRVAATAKHFPGLGAARVSTDDHRVSLGATYLDPFGRAIAAGAKLVMVSNAIYPALDAAGTPAVFSRPIVTGLLRGTFGFSGLVVSDALDAPTPARTPHAPARALAAGVDLLLYTSGGAAHAAYEQLRSDALASPLVRARLAQAVARIHTLEAWLGRICG